MSEKSRDIAACSLRAAKWRYQIPALIYTLHFSEPRFLICKIGVILLPQRVAVRIKCDYVHKLLAYYHI